MLPEDKGEARKVNTWASRYLFLSNILYKRSFTLSLLMCLFDEEADYVFLQIHEGIRGSHSRGRAMAHKAIRAGYYWSSMQNEATLLA